MNARKLIEREYKAHGGDVSRLVDPSGYDLAAERVIDKLIAERDAALKSVEELELDLNILAKSVDEEAQDYRERYRDRLDRMVAAVLNSRDQVYSSEDSSGLTVREATVKRAAEYLAAIDAAVEGRG